MRPGHGCKSFPAYASQCLCFPKEYSKPNEPAFSASQRKRDYDSRVSTCLIDTVIDSLPAVPPSLHGVTDLHDADRTDQGGGATDRWAQRPRVATMPEGLQPMDKDDEVSNAAPSGSGFSSARAVLASDLRKKGQSMPTMVGSHLSVRCFSSQCRRQQQMPELSTTCLKDANILTAALVVGSFGAEVWSACSEDGAV